MLGFGEEWCWRRSITFSQTIALFGYFMLLYKPLEQRCTRFLHVCSALCKCANWLCRTCIPHHTVAGRSSVSLTQSPFTFPSNCRCGPPLTSYMPGRSIPCTAQQHTSSHTVRCAWLVHLCTRAM
jgi:hypothetical protein